VVVQDFNGAGNNLYPPYIDFLMGPVTIFTHPTAFLGLINNGINPTLAVVVLNQLSVIS